MNKCLKKGSLLLFLLAGVLLAGAQPLAFPSAEGHGAYTTGGRGGRVIEVTNLNDSGEGSLRAAISASGARTVVFRVSGNIELKSKLSIKNGNLTIAGQTAPGDGITLRNYTLTVDASNVIIRYIRTRLGDTIPAVEDDAMNGRRKKNIIIDHCSMSWSVDECASFYDNENFTMQWCLIAESLYKSQHEKGNHGYGGIWGGMNASFHHNLIAHHTSRNPRFCGARYHMTTAETEIVDFRNNVIYNWGFNSAYGGESGNHNMVNNYYKYGPATSSDKRYRIINPSDASTQNPVSQWFIEGNYVHGSPLITANNWNGGVQGAKVSLDKLKAETPFPTGNIVTQTAEAAYDSVLANVGCNFPKRDTFDIRYIEETRTGTATFGGSYGAGKGIIDSQEEVGGWVELFSEEAPADTDHDGMPDAWEDEKGFDKNNPDDGNTLLSDGTTVLELYLNGLLGEEVKVGVSAVQMASELQLFPNPAQNRVTLQFELNAAADTRLVLRDLNGRTVLTTPYEYASAGFNARQLDVSGLNNGMYLLAVENRQSVAVIKMMVRR
ncbi:T9SS type A sorting domain-containing protein [Roseimarinus sediminis]|uniref:T9SS type A sorting domain-containing protein n=1 Tax=Roseimarinus sediminis TaxID=1610899 RepID=UPI003D1A0532